MLDGLIYIVGIGGNDRSVLRFDPLSGAWSNVASTLMDVGDGSSFVLDGCLYTTGGFDMVERYDAANDSWTRVAVRTSLSR
jgi:hypothetical protein